jgi:hypothetical protein
MRDSTISLQINTRSLSLMIHPKIVRQPRNHVLVSPFYGDDKDEKLLVIANDLLRRAG